MSGPFQPLGRATDLSVTPKKTISRIASTKLGVAMPMIEMPVER